MSHKLLIVEDDPAIVVSLEFLMAQQGYRVRIANCGEDGEKLAHEEIPDLILMDVNLPGLSGFDLCSQLRTEEAFSHTKIVLLTAKGKESDIQKGKDFGADTYITKPFSTRELVQTVQELLG